MPFNTLQELIDAVDGVQSTYTATTTTAASTTLYSLSLSDNTSYIFDIIIVAKRTTTSAKGCAGKLKFGAYRFNAGSATIMQDYSGTLKEIDTYGNSNYDFSVSASGNSILISVTGGASETVNWLASVRFAKVS